LAERSRGVFRAVVPGWPSMFCLLKSLEVLIKGDDLRENWRTFRLGNIAYVLQRRGNKCGRFIELSEMDVEGDEAVLSYRRVETEGDGVNALFRCSG